MKNKILIGMIILIALLVLVSGFLPQKHELKDCNYLILEGGREVCWVAETHYHPGWLVQLARGRK